MAVKHRDYVAECMRDPAYRFWHYVYLPRFWLQSLWISARIALRRVWAR